MKGKFSAFALAIATLVAMVSLGISIKAMKRDDAPEPRGDTPARVPLSAIGSSGGDGVLEARLAALERTIGSMAEASGEEPTPADSIANRLAAIESSLAKLTSAYEGISLEAASEERAELFRSEDGHLKADEYFAAGKFAIAGEGYLAFLEANPEHPEAYDILKRARHAFSKAGYEDKAVWAQKELLRNLGDARQPSDVMTLAQMEKNLGNYDDAIKHAAEAADISTNTQERLWNRMYWAWFNQLRDGDEAGLSAYREVQREIDAAGLTDEKLGAGVRDKIERIERVRNAASASN